MRQLVCGVIDAAKDGGDELAACNLVGRVKLERVPKAADKSFWERYEQIRSSPLRGRPPVPVELTPR